MYDNESIQKYIKRHKKDDIFYFFPIIQNVFLDILENRIKEEILINNLRNKILSSTI